MAAAMAGAQSCKWLTLVGKMSLASAVAHAQPSQTLTQCLQGHLFVVPHLCRSLHIFVTHTNLGDALRAGSLPGHHSTYRNCNMPVEAWRLSCFITEMTPAECVRLTRFCSSTRVVSVSVLGGVGEINLMSVSAVGSILSRHASMIWSCQLPISTAAIRTGRRGLWEWSANHVVM